ncbi:MAG: alpha amylase C-terminal domain-containing protein [Desulfobacterales bacterium]|jgi:1,4-alpha-glucan branching enzyme
MPKPDPIDALIREDPLLLPYGDVLRRRRSAVAKRRRHLTGDRQTLEDFASGHEFFGLHFRDGGWVFREWAPNATAISLIGNFSGWRENPAYFLSRTENGGDGVWEIRLPAEDLAHKEFFRLRVHWESGSGDRIPAWTRRVVQDPETMIFNAQVWRPPEPYRWKNAAPGSSSEPPLIYEAHIGMAQDAEKIGSYREFMDHVLPRVAASGYNTLQLMAIQEHPYYASFGYQVSSFFAPSFRYGPPEDLKALVDAAHGYGLRVFMDLIHSHAVANEVEGLSRFDGTLYQYFHDGPRGMHRAWGSRCFDYGKHQVLHFLLSNCRYWLDEFHFDGFRFDGITSMLYFHHGLGTAFTRYEDYFGDQVDEDALVYLGLANRLVHSLRPDATTIAEDVSGMPGLAIPAEAGGVGFDYRFAMGVPDYWIRLTKDTRDEDWPMGHLWFELTNRRREEKTISYAESHDQALVGDQTLVFRLVGSEMYDKMRTEDESLPVDRGIALHKMIRQITLATAGHGYLNFMGNEFGHPEWVDFPREGNGWSFRYARRQWHLADDPNLKYHFLKDFDREMIAVARRFDLLAHPHIQLLCEHNGDKVLAFMRAGLVFVFNFHPTRSFTDYPIPGAEGRFRLILDSDARRFGGHDRLVAGQLYEAGETSHTGAKRIFLYLPNRTALVLEHQ